MDRWTCSLSPERQRQRRRGRIAIHWECTGWLLREEGQWLVSTGGCEVLSCYISASSSPPCLSLSLSLDDYQVIATQVLRPPLVVE